MQCFGAVAMHQQRFLMSLSGSNLSQWSLKSLLLADFDIVVSAYALFLYLHLTKRCTFSGLIRSLYYIDFPPRMHIDNSVSIMAASSSKRTCYGSDEAVFSGAIPCNPQAEVSNCCLFTDICYSNGLCAPGPGQTNWGPTPYYTGYCTDRSWSNGTACPHICNNQAGCEFHRSRCTLVDVHSGCRVHD